MYSSGRRHGQSPGPFVKAIYAVGPSSTGKTTFCNTLSKALDIQNPAYVTEVARNVMRTTEFSRADVGKLEMQVAIMEAQASHEERGREAVAQKQFPMLLSDRSAVDPIVYATLTASTPEEARAKQEALVQNPLFQRVLWTYRESVVFLFEPVPEWIVDDGIRSLDQDGSLGVFVQVLQDLGIPYLIMRADMKDLAERVAFALSSAAATWKIVCQ